MTHSNRTMNLLPRTGRRLAGLAALAGLVITGAVAPEAGATSPPATVRAAAGNTDLDVQAQTADTTQLSLLGASASDYAVRQGPAHRLLLGATGSVLSYAQSGSVVGQLGTVDGVTGWTENLQPTNPASPLRLHRLDLGTRRNSTVVTGDRPLAVTGDGWIGIDDDGTLSRHVIGGAEDGLVDPLMSELPGDPVVAADATGALVISRQTDPDTNRSHYDLDQVDFADHQVHRIASSTVALSAPALSVTTLAWLSGAGDGSQVINSRPRPGGGGTRYVEPTTPLSRPAVAGDRVGWLIRNTAGDWYLRILTGSSTQIVSLPGPAEGLVAAGSTFVTAVGGPLETAGVYAIDTTAGPPDAVRVATVSAQTAAIRSVSLTGARLRVVDDSRADRPGSPVWQRTLAAASSPAVSGASLFTARVSPIQDAVFSAGRGLSGDPDEPGRFQLIDRGVATGSVSLKTADFETLQASGPYFRIGYRIFDSTGRRVYDAEPLNPTGFQLYGSRLAYGNSQGVWLRDLARPDTNALRLTDHCPACGDVATWGTTVAWVNGTTITVGDTDLGPTRNVNALGDPLSLTLGEGTLAWLSAGRTGILTGHVLDLTKESSVPVDLAGLVPIALDGHWLLAQRGSSDRYLVRRLPFGTDQRPRLIGAVTPASFSPASSSATQRRWQPQFDTSKPLSAVTMTLRTGAGRVVRTLHGTGPDGSIRTLSWDGRNGSGTAQPAGSYRWTLTAAAADGEGQLAAVNGTSVISGTVRLAR